MIKDLLQYSLRTLQQRKLRTSLTLLGIFVGIAAIVSLISLGQGFEKEINEQFELLGTDKLIITPKTAFAPPGSQTLGISLTEDDWDFVAKIKEVAESTVYIIVPAKIEFNDETRFFNVIGTDTGVGLKVWEELLGDVEIAEGRMIKKGDKFKAVVGNYHVERNLFKKNAQVRNTYKINGQNVKIVGVWDYIGSAEDDKAISMPLEAARELFEIPNRVDAIILKMEKGVDPVIVAEKIKRRLRNFRDLEEGKEDFAIQTFDEILRSLNQILGVIQLVLIAIAGISLLVGGIGIMNTMYTSVIERTKEIGIMKAIGARNRDITQLFILESGLLGAAGGIMGILIGIGFSKGVVWIIKNVLLFEFIDVFFPWYLILAVLAFSFTIGTVSGVLPAIQAARQQPVEALRYE
jgi:putative ABC transport system permease protein